MPAAFEKVGVQAVVEGFGRYIQNLGKMEAKSKGFGGALRGLGKRAAGVATGFIAAQASMAGVQAIMSKSIGAAVAYEAQMAEIRALTGATEKDTDTLTVAIKDMARAMPKSPAELGAAAYFILSSGIEDATEAAEVLEVAARASTIGLGETEAVANALTTVLNAYGKSAGEAGHVTDVMIEAVKQGKAEASEFAGVLGRVVPLAAQMGISFEEVAANLATFTRLGVSADEAATGLRQVMASLLKPTEQQVEAMEELGFSAEGLRQQIKDKGLLTVLDEMITATGGNEAAVAKLFPNIRALTSVLGTAGVQMDAYTDILAATSSATGNLDEGFAIVADTAKFKLGLAMNQLNLALMDLGTVALPIVVRLAEKLSALIGELEGFVGPAVDVATATNIAADSAERADTSFSLWDAVMAGATLNLERFKKEAFDAAGKTSLLSEEIDQQFAVLEKEAQALAETGKTTHDVAEETSEFDRQIAALSTRLGISEQALRNSGLGIEDLRDQTAELSAEIARAPASWQQFDAALAKGVALGIEAEAVLQGVAIEAAGAARTIPELAAAFEALAVSVMGANAALQAMAGGFSAIAGQHTAESLALDMEINALEQELNATQQAGIGQQSYGDAVKSATSAIDDQIRALEQQAAALIPQAIQDEIIALEHEATVLELVTAEIEGQIIAKEEAIKAHQDQVDAIQEEIDAQEDLLKSLGSTLKGLNAQIKAEKELAAERAGYLPHNIKINKLELEKAKLLQKAEGNTDNLSDAERARLEKIEELIDAEQLSIRIKELEAEATELQAEKSGEHLKALEAEKAAIEAEMAAAEENIRVREEYIDSLHPPELLAEIQALKDQKAEVEAQITTVGNLKRQRELYIKTLMPPELQQEIARLKDQKAALDDASTAAGGLTGATGSLTGALDDQIAKLELEREAIDLVTKGWELQGKKIAGLPTIPDILSQLKGYKALLMLDLQKELMDAFKAGDFAKVGEIAGWIAKLGAITFAQHGFHGEVGRPTLFMAGEGAGRERVDITPQPSAVREMVLAPSVAPQAPALAAPAVDPTALAGAVAFALQGLTVEMDGRIVGSIINDRIGDRTSQLGRGG